jgi:hypothetical protein
MCVEKKNYQTWPVNVDLKTEYKLKDSSDSKLAHPLD